MARGDQVTRTLLIIRRMYDSRYGVTISQLADDLDMSQKTIRRDLAFIDQAMFPMVEETREGKRHFKLMQGVMEELDIPFSPEELMSLYFFKDFVLPLEGTGFEVPFRRLINKIEDSLPEKAKATCDELSSSFHSLIPHRSDYKELKEIFKMMNDALMKREAIKITYYSYSSKRTTKRKIYPYSFYYYQGTIYVVAKDDQSKEIRTFHVGRIRKANPLKEKYKIPKNFDGSQYFKDSFGIIKGKDTILVKIVFDKTVAPFVQERMWHPTQQLKTLKGDQVELTLEVNDTKELKTWVMGFTNHAEVVEPKTLREEIKKDISKMVKKYT